MELIKMLVWKKQFLPSCNWAISHRHTNSVECPDMTWWMLLWKPKCQEKGEMFQN